MKNNKNLLIIVLILALAIGAAAYYFTMSKDYSGRAVMDTTESNEETKKIKTESLDTKNLNVPATVDRKKFTPKTSGPRDILGCMAKAACNYNKKATKPDFGQCVFPADGFNCEGEATNTNETPLFMR